jgi:hypothetical protein
MGFDAQPVFWQIKKKLVADGCRHVLLITMGLNAQPIFCQIEEEKMGGWCYCLLVQPADFNEV